MEQGSKRGDAEAPKHEGAKVGTLVWAAVACSCMLVFAMASGVLWLSWQQFDARASEASRSRLEGLSQTLAMRFERITVAQSILLDAVERQLAKGEGQRDAAEIDALISRLDGRAGGAYFFRVVDEEGFITHGSGVNVRPKVSYADRDYFKNLLENPSSRLEVSPLLFGKVIKKSAIVMALAVRNAKGGFGGIVIAAVYQDSLLELARPYQVAPDDAVAIRDARDLSLIARSPAPEAGKVSVLPQQIKEMMNEHASSGSGVTKQTAEGKPRSYAYELMKGIPFYVIAGVGRQSFFEPWREQAWLSAGLCSLFLAMACAMAARVSRSAKAEASAKRDHAELNASLEREVQDRTRDLSEALERVRKSRDELADAERLASLGAMVSTVAHELNTPIGNALLSNSAIVERSIKLRSMLEAGSVKKSELARGLADIEALASLQADSVGRAGELVRAFKQVSVDQASERRRVFDAREVLASVIESLRPSLSRSLVKMEVRLEVPPGISCDTMPGALIQIATNMIQNAQAHAFEGRDGGCLRIGARVEGESSSRWVCIEFVDDGVGMSESTRSMAFDPFFTTKVGAGGSGIGLSLSKKLAQSALCGSLSVSSYPGRGARFSLEFPASKPVG